MTKDEIIKEFTKIKGVGKAKAEALYDKGYTSIEKLKGTKIEELQKIEGITESIAKNIVDNFKDKTESKKIDKKPADKPKTQTKKKAEPKKGEQKKPAEEDKEEPVKKEKPKEKEVEKEKEIKIKKKPELKEDIKKSLTLRKEIKNRTPNFLREEWFRYKRIPKNWRRPDGITSKMRINLKYRPSKVRVGFRGPKEVRGLHSSGFEEIMVFNVNDLQGINPKTQAARIGRTVGTKKRIDIEKKAEEMDIRILNM